MLTGKRPSPSDTTDVLLLVDPAGGAGWARLLWRSPKTTPTETSRDLAWADQRAPPRRGAAPILAVVSLENSAVSFAQSARLYVSGRAPRCATPSHQPSLCESFEPR